MSRTHGHLRAVPETDSVDLLTRTDHGGGSLGSRAIGLGMRATVRPFISTWSMTNRLPWPYELADQVGRVLRKPHGMRLDPLDLPDCKAHVISNVHVDQGRVIIYFQGGAFLVGGFHLHQQMIGRISQLTGSTVVVPQFRKLPRHPVATSIADGLAAYRHALERGIRPEDVTFMGDSAGGFLTFMVAIAAREEGLPLPGGLVAMSPLIDLDHTRRTMRPGGDTLFSPRAIQTLTRVVERAHGRTLSKLAATHSPTNCELGGLPPTLIQVSSAELLYDDASRMARLLADAGVSTDLQVWDHQVHVFQAAHRVIPEAAQALREIRSFVDLHIPGRYGRALRSATG